MSQPRRENALAIHSVDRFVISVPDLAEAARFYTAFGLDVRQQGDRLDLHTFGHPHCWGQVHASGKPKRLEYLSFGAYAEDLDRLRSLAIERGLTVTDPHPLGSSEGFWLRDPDGVAIQVRVTGKVSPSSPSPVEGKVVKTNAVNASIAPMRSEVAGVRPTHLSHLLIFSSDIDRAMGFYCDLLGFRLSDRSADVLAFTHGAHSSDHHLLALAKSEGPGLHHASWSVARVDEVGMGMEQMLAAGYTEGWGVGRHVIGSNYFYYARDPWGGFCEFSCDIDFIDEQTQWPSGDYPPEDSMYLWGPAVPPYFIENHDAARHSGNGQ